MKKRFVSALLAALMLLTLLPVSAFGATTVASGYCGGDTTAGYDSASESYKNLTWTLDSAGTLTISGTGAMTNTKPWDDYCNSIVTVIIGDNVTNISDWAFFGFSNLTSIAIPASVTSIGEHALESCYSLANITIPGNVTTIGSFAFFDCESLTDIAIPNSVTSIGFDAFGKCTSLANISVGSSNLYYCTDASGILYDIEKKNLIRCPVSLSGSYSIPNSVVSIEICAFDGCSKVSNITIPDSVTNIGNCAFDGCSNLSNITIPNGITAISPGMFDGCSSLTSVILPNGITGIGYAAFAGCSSLTDIAIPNSVTSIGFDAFFNCSSLTNITIPNSVTSIGGSAFFSCDNLKKIIIPKSVTSIGEAVFYATPVVIYCFRNSAADQYAKESSISVEYLDDLNEISITLAIGKTETLDITAAIVHDKSQTIIWSSSDNKVATVSSNGVVTAKGAGTAVITATAEDRSFSASCTVTVNGSDTPSGGCYVATCVYGSYDCPEVWTLRRFRDETLAQTWYGRAFIHTYYAISPTLVKWFGDTDWFKNMWRGTLDKMVENLNTQGVPDTPYDDIDW